MGILTMNFCHSHVSKHEGVKAGEEGGEGVYSNNQPGVVPMSLSSSFFLLKKSNNIYPSATETYTVLSEPQYLLPWLVS